jgi:hypothetical protein
MRIWLIGGGHASVKPVRQLWKSADLELIVSAPIERPAIVEQGIIDQVDYVEMVTPLNINTQARRVRPDLILLDADAASFSRGTGASALSQALAEESAAASDYPCLVI